MKRTLIFIVILSCAFSAFAIDISRVEPAFWWTGMKNTELQIMVYGKDIARSSVQFEYPGIRLKELVRVENPNYLFLYLLIDRNTRTVRNNNFHKLTFAKSD